MIILHIACISDDKFSGVNNAVPKFVISQQKIAQVGFVNLLKRKIENINNQFDLKRIKDLPIPFNKPNLVIFHEVYRPQFLRISKDCNKLKIPYIIVPHGCLTKEAQRKKRFKKALANILLFNRFIKKAKALQYLSKTESDRSHYGSKKFVLGNGIDLPELKKELFFSDGIRFLFIGRLEIKIKGLDLLFQVVNSLQNFLRKNTVKFIVCGPSCNESKDFLKDYINKNELEDLIVLKEPVIGKEKVKEIMSADCFIQTSRTEGMPMGILEAMSYGLPCLITRGTALAEIVEENNAGWWCETDFNDIKKNIMEAVEKKEDYMLKSKNARKLIEEKFCWDNIARDSIAQYDTMLRG